jgi:lysine 2,3-aminomutase
LAFLKQVVPAKIPGAQHLSLRSNAVSTREDFLKDVQEGLKAAPMSVRLTPHIMSVADWSSPLDDPIVRQFIPIKSGLTPDHPQLTFDSLHEEGDSPVPGLVHRYPDKVLFLGESQQSHHAASIEWLTLY